MKASHASVLPAQSEAEIQAHIRLAIGRVPHARLFRNQVGEGWIGEVAHRDQNTVTLVRPRRVPFGLCPGSGDLIGWTTVTITHEMVGAKLAVFTSGEVKRPSITKLPADQQNWCDAVTTAGGYADMIRSVADGLRLVRG